MTALPLPNNSAVSADLSEENAGHLADASIDIDSGTDASDAGYKSDNTGTVSTSLASSVEDYTFENGRRYHKFHEKYYHFPNNNPEQEKEIIAHTMILYLYDQLHFTLIKINLQIILDINTRTGI